jgi:hypothetical protein
MREILQHDICGNLLYDEMRCMMLLLFYIIETLTTSHIHMNAGCGYSALE